MTYSTTTSSSRGSFGTSAGSGRFAQLSEEGIEEIVSGGKKDVIILVSTHGNMHYPYGSAPDDDNAQTDTGGQVVYVHKIAEELAKKTGKEVLMVTRRVDGGPAEIDVEDLTEKGAPGVKLVRVPSVNENCQKLDPNSGQMVSAGLTEFIRKEDLLLGGAMEGMGAHFFEWLRDNDYNMDTMNVVSNYVDALVFTNDMIEAAKAEGCGDGIRHTCILHSYGIAKEGREGEKPEYRNDPAAFYRAFRFPERNAAEKALLNSKNCHIVGLTSPDQRQWAEAYGIDDSKITIYPAGCDPDRFVIDPEAGQHFREKIGITDPDVKLVGMIGRLEGHKGLDTGVEAFAKAMIDNPDQKMKLVIGGGSKKMTRWAAASEEERASLEENGEKPGELELKIFNEFQAKIAEYGIEDHVQYVGFVEDEDLNGFYNALELFLLPCSYEPIGMTAVEAMGCGVLTTITPNGGLKDYVEDGKATYVLRVDNVRDDGKLDTNHLGGVISQVMSDDRDMVRAHDLMREAARAAVLDQLTWKGIAGLINGGFDESRALEAEVQFVHGGQQQPELAGAS